MWASERITHLLRECGEASCFLLFPASPMVHGLPTHMLVHHVLRSLALLPSVQCESV